MTTKPNTNGFTPTLVADIGGTNARFRIVHDTSASPIVFDDVSTAAFESIEQAIEQTVFGNLEQLGAPKPTKAIIAAAGPITQNGLNLTNCHWNIRPDHFLSFGSIEELILMNDFEAQALSLPFLTNDDRTPLGGVENVVHPNATKVVLGPGTGLGVGLLVRASGKWVPVAGEGGHVDLGPRSNREAEVWGHLDKVEGRISAEQILCGPGLLNTYRAVCQADAVSVEFETPAQISLAAVENTSAQAVEALHIFCRCLGRVAGDLALTSMAKGGVYIAGGIGRKILPFLRTSDFRKSFDDKAPHSQLMREVETSVVTHNDPALLGLASYAQDAGAFALDIDHRQWRR